MKSKSINEWQLYEAKARLSEVIRKAQTHGPQIITIHGNPVVVVVSIEEYQKMQAAS